MDFLPANVLSALSSEARKTAVAWWAALSDAERRDVIGLWDERLEIAFFRPQADDSGRMDDWEKVPAVRGGRFLPHDDDGRQEWMPGHVEYLLVHPELSYEPPPRLFFVGRDLFAAARMPLTEFGNPPASNT